MPIVNFLRENARWIVGGFLLTFFSSFGQTFFISLSAGDIRAENGLSHGQFGGLYMIATLASALTLPQLGKVVDRVPIAVVAAFTIPALMIAAISMSFASNVIWLGVTIYALRLFGQGMMTHISMTAMGRWFSAQRVNVRCLARSEKMNRLSRSSYQFCTTSCTTAVPVLLSFDAAARSTESKSSLVSTDLAPPKCSTFGAESDGASVDSLAPRRSNSPMGCRFSSACFGDWSASTASARENFC